MSNLIFLNNLFIVYGQRKKVLRRTCDSENNHQMQFRKSLKLTKEQKEKMVVFNNDILETAILYYYSIF